VRYEPGDAVRLTWAIDDPDTRTPVGGATVTLTLTPSGGTATPVTPTEVSPGRWTVTIIVTVVGVHGYRWTATGAAQASDSGTFSVVAPRI
jgi:hypothetical protein